MIKARKENGKVKRYINVPKYWAHYAGNFAEQSDEVHESFGFYIIHFPEYDTNTQIRSNELLPDLVDIGGTLYYTYGITDKTAEQLEAEATAKLEALDSEVDNDAMKRILQRYTDTLLDVEENITEELIQDTATLYPVYKPNKLYIVDEKFRYEGMLYKVVQEHTSQSNWLPDTLPALYTKYNVPGTINPWVQPTGAQDAYNIGDKVSFEGSNYESLIDDNVWSPTAYPAGWTAI